LKEGAEEDDLILKPDKINKSKSKNKPNFNEK